jgi:hypothetical protein
MPGIIAALAGSGTPYLLTKGTTARQTAAPNFASKAVPVGKAVQVNKACRSQSSMNASTCTSARYPDIKSPARPGPNHRRGKLPCLVLAVPILHMITDNGRRSMRSLPSHSC